MPHRCNIGRQVRSIDADGGSAYTFTVEQTNKECWEQKANSNTVQMYEKRGIKVDVSVFFPFDPQVTERHRILITSRFGVAEPLLDMSDVSNANMLDVMSSSYPDASAGQGVLWRVECNSGRGGRTE